MRIIPFILCVSVAVLRQKSEIWKVALGDRQHDFPVLTSRVHLLMTEEFFPGHGSIMGLGIFLLREWVQHSMNLFLQL